MREAGTPSPGGGDHSEKLRTSSVFAALSAEALARVLASATPMDLDPGRRLFARGDGGDACYLVASGELEAVATDAQGRTAWLASLKPGDVIGELSLLDGGVRSADITAVRRCRLLRIGREAVLNALRAEPDAALALLAVLAARLRGADARVEEAALLGLGGRLARVLLNSGSAPVTLAQGEIARLVGASRERVNRTLSDWRSRGWVSVGRSGIRVLDPGALAGLASSDHRP